MNYRSVFDQFFNEKMDNFLKNSVCNFLNYEISGVLKNTENLDRTGFYVGNSHSNLEKQMIYSRHGRCQTGCRERDSILILEKAYPMSTGK